MVAAAIASGVLIGLTLGLVGGGGSILAVPLLVYVVKVGAVHKAIGTAAAVVALNAMIGLAGHARKGNVKWPCGIVLAASGIAGAWAGAAAGQRIDGSVLLSLFGLLMMVVAMSMLRRREVAADANVRLSPMSARRLLPQLIPAGFAVGGLSGFFGIGGGFLIVPALVAATNMPMANATATSLIAVVAFGLTTATSYAISGGVDWQLATLLLAGGVAGAVLGVRVAGWMKPRQRSLEAGFATLVAAVGASITWQGLPDLARLLD